MLDELEEELEDDGFFSSAGVVKACTRRTIKSQIAPILSSAVILSAANEMELEDYFDLTDLSFVPLPFVDEKRKEFERRLAKHTLIPQEQLQQGFLFYQALVAYARVNGVNDKDYVLHWLTLLYLYVDGAMDIQGVTKKELYRQYQHASSPFWERVHHYMQKCKEEAPHINFLPLLHAQVKSSEHANWDTAYLKGYETGVLVDQLLFHETRAGGKIAGLVQIADDLLDIPEDLEAGIATPATDAYNNGDITSLLQRLSVEASKLEQPWPLCFSYAIAFIVQKYPSYCSGFEKYENPRFDPRWHSYFLPPK